MYINNSKDFIFRRKSNKKLNWIIICLTSSWQVQPQMLICSNLSFYIFFQIIFFPFRHFGHLLLYWYFVWLKQTTKTVLKSIFELRNVFYLFPIISIFHMGVVPKKRHICYDGVYPLFPWSSFIICCRHETVNPPPSQDVTSFCYFTAISSSINIFTYISPLHTTGLVE